MTCVSRSCQTRSRGGMGSLPFAGTTTWICCMSFLIMPRSARAGSARMASSGDQLVAERAGFFARPPIRWQSAAAGSSAVRRPAGRFSQWRQHAFDHAAAQPCGVFQRFNRQIRFHGWLRAPPGTAAKVDFRQSGHGSNSGVSGLAARRDRAAARRTRPCGQIG